MFSQFVHLIIHDEKHTDFTLNFDQYTYTQLLYIYHKSDESSQLWIVFTAEILQICRCYFICKACRFAAWFFAGDSNLLIRNAIFDFYFVVVAVCFVWSKYLYDLVIFCGCVGSKFVLFFRFFVFILTLFCWLSQIELLLSVYWRTV